MEQQVLTPYKNDGNVPDRCSTLVMFSAWLPSILSCDRIDRDRFEIPDAAI